MTEVWKDIPNYDGIYKVSNHGRVKSLRRYTMHRGFLRLIKPRILKHGHDSYGYPMVCLTKDGVPKTVLVHKLVAKAFILNQENKPQVNHIDGNKANNYTSNLEWVTNQENVIHAFRTGISNADHCTGERSWITKLTNQDILSIRKLMSQPNKPTQQSIADQHGVSQMTIHSIITRKTWKHI